MTVVEHPSVPRSVPVGGRLVAAAAFALPPLVLLAVGLGFAFRGGGVAPEQWQSATIGLAASLFVLAAVGAVPRVDRAALPLLVGLAALLLWSASSMGWTASQEATFEHVLRLALLAGAAAVGLLYGARPRAALALGLGLALFGVVSASAMEVRLLMGSTESFVGSRLSWPINYANADAALVWLPLPALLAFAAAQPLRPLVRAAFALFAALSLAVGLVPQSRGAAIAVAGALIASVVIARDRGRYGLTMLAIAAPVAAIAPRMVGTEAPSAALVRDRGEVALLAAASAAVLVCALSMLDRRRRFPFGGREGRVALACWAVALALAAGAFLAASGRPDAWVSARWDEFTNVGSASAPPSDAAHFGTGVSNRYDYWRVAWHTFEDDPIAGVGAGAFSVPWFRARSIDENVTDPHSWQAAALAEAGLVGFVLTAFVLLFPLARIRSARVGQGAWPIAAVALGGAGVYFVLHASLDWLFRIPAIAIPGFVVLGALASGGQERVGRVFGGLGQRLLLAIAAIVVVALAVPAYLSTTRVVDAEAKASTSPAEALADLDDASRLNPFATEPLLVRSLILKVNGRPRRALAAADDAVDRAPESWVAWLLLADTRRLAGDASGARAALNRAAGLNPRAVRAMGLKR